MNLNAGWHLNPVYGPVVLVIDLRCWQRFPCNEVCPHVEENLTRDARARLHLNVVRILPAHLFNPNQLHSESRLIQI